MFIALNSSIVVLMLAAIILAVINAFYRFMIDQEKAYNIKQRVSELNRSMRKEPEKQKELYKEVMSLQKQQMRMSMKPMLLSFIVVMVLLPWLAAEFQDHTANFANNTATLTIGNMNYTFSRDNSSLVVNGRVCQTPCNIPIEGNIWTVSVSGDTLRLSVVAAVLPFSLPILGKELGWIWWYIICSIPLALIVRALYGIKA